MTDSRADEKSNTSSSGGGFGRWWQRTTNNWVNKRIRNNHDTFMGMDVLILHTVGSRSGEKRETPVAWFPDTGASKVVVASGGGSASVPDWCRNLGAHPDKVAMELSGQGLVAVTLTELEGAERKQAWKTVTDKQARYDKYEKKAGREFPVFRLTPQ